MSDEQIIREKITISILNSLIKVLLKFDMKKSTIAKLD
jgi:hypothetical protein